MAPPRSTRSVTIVAVTILIAVACGAVYYLFSYQVGRQAYFSESRLRALGVLAEQIEGAVGSRRAALRSAVEQDLDLLVDPAARAKNPLPDVLRRGGLEMVGAERCPLSDAEVRVVMGIGPATRSTDSLEYGSSTHEVGAALKLNATLQLSERGTCAETDLATLISPFVSGDGFDGVELFIGQNESVVYERGRATLRLSRLFENSGAENGAAAAGKQAPTPQAHPTVLPRLRELAVGSAVHDVELGGVPYKLFTHPLRLQTDSVWILGALVPTQQFSAEVRELSFGSFTYVPLLLIVAVLSIPLLKIGIIGRRDRLRARDVRLAAISVVTTAALVTVLGLDVITYTQLGIALDEELQATSETLRANLQDELAAAVSALQRFAERAAPAARAVEGCADRPRYTTRLVSLFNGFTDTHTIPGPVVVETDAAVLDGTLTGRPALSDADRTLIQQLWGEYPYLDMLVWADACGWQHEKWTTKSQTTQVIQVGSFQFFSDTVRGRLSQMKGARDGTAGDQAARFTFHVQVSPNTGKLVPLLSVPLTKGDDTVGTATMVPELMSVIDPILPPGFGFAIVQNDGRVVLHSLKQRSLYENFLEEASAAREIRSLIEARHGAAVESDYHGRRTRLWVEPIKDSQWTLIVFRDKELLRALHLDIMTTWVALALVGLGIFLLGRMVLGWALPPDEADWLWPSADRQGVYHECLLALLFATGAFAGVIAWSAGAPLLAMGAGGAIVVGTLCSMYLCLAPAHDGRALGRRWRRRCAAALLAGAWALCAFTLGRWGGSLLAPAALALETALVVLRTKYPAPAAPSVAHVGVLWVLALGCAVGTLSGHVPTSVVFAPLALAVAWLCWRMGFRDERQWPLAWEHAYVGIGIAALTVFAVLPAALLYQDAFDTGLEIFVRQNQLKWAEALDRREDRVRQDYRDLGNASLTEARLSASCDVVPSGLFGSAWPDSARRRETESPSSSGWRCLMGRALAQNRSNQPVGDPPPPADLQSPHVSSAIMTALPTYHRESLQLRGMGARAAADQRWWWSRAKGNHAGWRWQWSPDPSDGGSLTWLRGAHVGNYTRGVISATHDLPDLERSLSLGSWSGVLAISLFGPLVFWLLLRWLADRVMGLDENHGRPPAAPAGAQVAVGLFVASPHLEICPKSPHFEVVDFRSAELAWGRCTTQIDASLKPFVLLQHLEERFSDADRRRAKLELLEALIIHCAKPIVLISQIEPLGHLSRRLQSRWDATADDEISPELIARWARVLERLAWVGPDQQVAGDAELVALLRQLTTLQNASARLSKDDLAPEALREECRNTARLLGIGWELRMLGGVSARDDAGTTTERVADAARAHYRSVWSLLTDEEQLALVQLAHEGFVNPKSWGIVRVLVRKGFIRFAPAARLVNKTFSEFVKTAEAPDRVTAWERADGASVWDRARNGILLLLIAGGLVLFLTQPEELTRWVGVLTAIGSAVATVANLFGFFGGPRATPARAQ